MVSLKIKDVLDFQEYIVKGKGVETSIVLDIFGLSGKLNVEDNLMLHEELLDKNSTTYTMPISFEVVTNKTGEEIKSENNKEYAVVKTNGKIYALKRIYG